MIDTASAHLLADCGGDSYFLLPATPPAYQPMPHSFKRQPHLLAFILLLAALVSACDSPTDPRDSNLIAFGSVYTGHLSAGEVKRFEVEVDAGQGFAVYLEVTVGAIGLELRDSAHTIGPIVVYPGPTTAINGLSAIAGTRARYTIVLSAPGQQGADFTLRPTLIDWAPEHARQSIALGDVVSGERIDHPYDQDEFLVDIPAAQEAELYLSSDVGDPFYVTVGRVGITASAFDDFIWPPDGWADLQLGASGRIALDGGRYAVRISGTAGSAYTFQLRTVNPKPEAATELLTLGDTVAESIDYVGDYDDFMLRGTPRAEYEVFVSAGGTAPHQAQVLLLGLAEGAGPFAGAEPGGALLDSATGRFAMPSTGQVTVRVRDWQDKVGGFYRGPYHLVAVAIDRRPEGRADVMTPSRNVIASALELYGDVDEYGFTLAAPTRLALRCAPTADGGCSVYRAAVFRDDAPTHALALDDGVPLPAGAYRMRVESGAGLRSSPMYRGPYQFVLAPVDTVPEDVGTTLSVGTTVSESASWPWDIDTFTLDVTAADTLIVRLDSISLAGSVFRTAVTDLLTGRQLGVDGTYGAANRRIDPVPGRYAVSVLAFTTDWQPDATRTYRLGIQRASAAPEGRAVAVAVRDTVRSNFDYEGDIDDYVLTGAPWEVVDFTLIPEHASTHGGMEVVAVTAIEPASGTTLGVTSSFGYYGSFTGIPVEIPGGGTLRLRVCNFSNCSVEHYTGPYTISVNHVNGPPESRPAAFAMGDTVTESLESGMDVDEFTFDGAAGQVVDLVGLQAPATPGGSTGAIVEVIDQTTNDRVGQLSLRAGNVGTMGAALSGLGLPHTGRYLVRFRSEPSAAFEYPAGPYRFLITPH
jgi:hypothetical protein